MYAKLFSSLYQGTLRGRSDEILVFTNLLAHTGKDGTVDKHFKAIAEETGLTVDEVKAAIHILESPDPESRSPEENGARIVRLDEHRVWGWRVVNHGKYRAIRSEDDRAEQNRLSQKRWRERHKDSVSNSKPSVSTDKPDKPIQKQKQEAEAEAETKAFQPEDPPSSPSGFDEFWRAYPRKIGKGAAEKIWQRMKLGTILPLLLTAIRAAKVSPQWTKEGGQFIPNPATWLNQRRWEDEPMSGVRTSGQSSIPGEHERIAAAVPIVGVNC